MTKKNKVSEGRKTSALQRTNSGKSELKKGSTAYATENMPKDRMAAPDKSLTGNSGMDKPAIPKYGTSYNNRNDKPLKILFVAAECLPFIATGGLGDVTGSLPSEIADQKRDVRIILPLYAEISAAYRKNFVFIGSTEIALSWRRQYCGIYTYSHNNIIYYFTDNEYYFGRKGIYGHYDDGERFAFFSKCVPDILNIIDFVPDIIHCNDWHTALVPVYLKTLYKDSDVLKNIKSVFTIHNIEYQGKFSKDILEDVFSLDQSSYSVVEYDGNINLMKGAVQCCDALTSVSPKYAEEITTPHYSLHYIINENKQKLKGILNGIDYSEYNPRTDQSLFKNYGADTIEYKSENKKGLQRLLNLQEDEEIPVISVISRLVRHKGIDLIAEQIEKILKDRVQVIILGKGDLFYENLFQDIEKAYSEKFRAIIAFNPDLAKKIYAGADMLLMPSKTEPCGLSQMIASRYGTVPLVRETGGLYDSIKDMGAGQGNGFTFKEYNAVDMHNCIKRALNEYSDKEKWSGLARKIMDVDFSWKKSANEYIKLYENLLQ